MLKSSRLMSSSSSYNEVFQVLEVCCVKDSQII